jgi:hypothetical protein
MRKWPALLILLMLGAPSVRATTHPPPHRHTSAHHHRHHLAHRVGWAGAGIAAGHFAGPAGSAAVGGAKYRHDLKAGGRRRTRAMVKIGAPIAAGAVAGPAGTVGYEAVEHRKWIKRHVLRRGRHHARHRHDASTRR